MQFSIFRLTQILIVQFGGEMFNVTPLPWNHWLIIILATSPTLLIGEAIRWVRQHYRK